MTPYSSEITGPTLPVVPGRKPNGHVNGRARLVSVTSTMGDELLVADENGQSIPPYQRDRIVYGAPALRAIMQQAEAEKLKAEQAEATAWSFEPVDDESMSSLEWMATVMASVAVGGMVIVVLSLAGWL